MARSAGAGGAGTAKQSRRLSGPCPGWAAGNRSGIRFPYGEQGPRLVLPAGRHRGGGGRIRPGRGSRAGLAGTVFSSDQRQGAGLAAVTAGGGDLARKVGPDAVADRRSPRRASSVRRAGGRTAVPWRSTGSAQRSTAETAERGPSAGGCRTCVEPGRVPSAGRSAVGETGVASGRLPVFSVSR